MGDDTERRWPNGGRITYKEAMEYFIGRQEYENRHLEIVGKIGELRKWAEGANTDRYRDIRAIANRLWALVVGVLMLVLGWVYNFATIQEHLKNP
jgi:hypothetical protein